MKLLEDVKKRLGRIQADNLIRNTHVQRQSRHFDEATYIGILYNAGDDEEAALVHNYTAALRKQGKKVFEMGYVDEKELPFKYKFLANSEYFWKKSLQWNYLPKMESVGRFIQEEFDYLLNLYTDRTLWLESISGMSHARLRVGKYHENNKLYYDLMIDTGNEHSLANFIKQVDRYIKSV